MLFDLGHSSLIQTDSENRIFVPYVSLQSPTPIPIEVATRLADKVWPIKRTLTVPVEPARIEGDERDPVIGLRLCSPDGGKRRARGYQNHRPDTVNEAERLLRAANDFFPNLSSELQPSHQVLPLFIVTDESCVDTFHQRVQEAFPRGVATLTAPTIELKQ